jgi:hypothetical protein
MRRLSTVLATLAAVLLVSPAPAHHSPAMFDLGQDRILDGRVEAYSFRNPHIYFELAVGQPDGTSVNYRVEAGGAANMVALGFAADAVSIGERISVRVKPNRNPDDRTVLGWLLTKADGTEIPLHVRAMSATEPGDAEAGSLAGTWIPQATGFSALAAAARTWPLTETGRAAVESTQTARDVSRSSCVPFGPPALMALPLTMIVEITETEVSFRTDVLGAVRVVRLDRSEHPKTVGPSLHGHSIGHWEGETLVVDTVGYAAHPDGYAFDLPSSAAKHIVERFTLADDRKHIDYEAIVEDPEYIAEPVTHRQLWDYRPDQMPSNLPCDPDAASDFTETY